MTDSLHQPPKVRQSSSRVGKKGGVSTIFIVYIVAKSLLVVSRVRFCQEKAAEKAIKKNKF